MGELTIMLHAAAQLEDLCMKLNPLGYLRVDPMWRAAPLVSSMSMQPEPVQMEFERQFVARKKDGDTMFTLYIDMTNHGEELWVYYLVLDKGGNQTNPRPGYMGPRPHFGIRYITDQDLCKLPKMEKQLLKAWDKIDQAFSENCFVAFIHKLFSRS